MGQSKYDSPRRIRNCVRYSGGRGLKRITVNAYYNPAPDADSSVVSSLTYENPSSSKLKNVIKSTKVQDTNGTPVARNEFFYDDANNKGNLIETKVWDSAKTALTSPSDCLRQAELCLEKALNIDADYLPALIDLAYFYLRVLDNSKKGRKLFEKAVQLSKENYVESLVGLVECEAELVSNKSALKLLLKLETKKIESSTIKKLKTNLNS